MYKAAPGMHSLVVSRPHKDHPYDEIVLAMQRLVNDGNAVMVKFTCSGCHQRVMGKPNDWSPIQICPKCGHHHDFDKSGGNYAISRLLNHDTTYRDSFEASVAFYKAQNGG